MFRILMRAYASASDVVLLPYIKHFGSSGVLSLSAAAGKMVIASLDEAAFAAEKPSNSHFEKISLWERLSSRENRGKMPLTQHLEMNPSA